MCGRCICMMHVRTMYMCMVCVYMVHVCMMYVCIVCMHMIYVCVVCMVDIHAWWTHMFGVYVYDVCV